MISKKLTEKTSITSVTSFSTKKKRQKGTSRGATLTPFFAVNKNIDHLEDVEHGAIADENPMDFHSFSSGLSTQCTNMT